MKSTPTRGVKQYLKPDAYNQSELDWTLMTIVVKRDLNKQIEYGENEWQMELSQQPCF